MIKSVLGWLAVVSLLGFVGCGSDDGDGGGGASCKDGCTKTVAADCPNGPTQAECEMDCAMLRAGECKDEFDALQACGTPEPVTCDAAGNPGVSSVCDAQFNAFINCLLM
jgi:hypothetical protein